MKKSEIKAASTEELILTLCSMLSSPRILKRHIEAAKWICEEFKQRGILPEGNTLFSRWKQRYEL